MSILNQFHKIMPNKSYKIAALILLAIFLLAGSFWLWNKSGKKESEPVNQDLKEAGKEGEKIVHKLMVQIENPKGNAEDVKGRYERGDIVLIFPADHQFSLAEKEGFLIVQMEMTPKQAEILTRALEEKNQGEEMKEKEDSPKTLKRRKFAIDLTKIGISPEDEKGREMGGEVFGWSIILEK